jgi:hypothetical protein
MIRELILQWARNRKPDFVIGGKDSPYVRRHWLLPRNWLFNVYVHEFLRSDDDRALHDHPWLFNASWIIEGEYVEWVPTYDRRLPWNLSVRCQYPQMRILEAGDVRFRWGRAAHRVELFVDWKDRPLPCWTVFVTGPRVREWGFHCPKGWIPWQRFTAASDPGAVGKGCEE